VISAEYFDRAKVKVIRNQMFSFLRRSPHHDFFGPPTKPVTWDQAQDLHPEVIMAGVEMFKVFAGIYDAGSQCTSLAALTLLYLKDPVFRATVDALVYGAFAYDEPQNSGDDDWLEAFLAECEQKKSAQPAKAAS
jgi:hypothetical protein